jgi:hypothetical protein
MPFPTTQENEDWMKRTWDMPTTWRGFYQHHLELYLGRVDAEIAKTMKLPVASAMPTRLRNRVEAFLAATGKERDAMRPV